MGKSTQEVIGRTAEEIFGDPDIARIPRERDRRVMDSGQTEVAEEIFQTPAGKKIILSTKSPRRDANGRIIGMVVVARDITERKKAEELLRNSHEILRGILGTTLDGYMSTDAQGRLLDVNPRYCQQSGYTREELLGMQVTDLDVQVTAAFVEENAKQVIADSSSQFETMHRRKDGTIWHAEVSTSYSEATDGRFFVFLRDITDRLQAEKALRLQSEELVRANAEVTRFVYTVSHDLKSPLVTIKTFLGYLEKDLASNDTERMAKDMAYAHTAADKMSGLLDELLELSRVGRKVAPFAEVPLQAIVKEAMDLVAGRIAQRGVSVEVTAGPILLFGDRRRLMEVYQNLLDNAAKFMGDQPTPRVEIGAEVTDDETVLFVRDNGLGIDPRHKARLFGLFEKLNPHTEGHGMGLAMVRRIVEMHGGKIWVESDGVGKGATFRFTLAKATVTGKDTSHD